MIFKRFDYLSSKVTLFYDGNLRHKSIPSGILTIIAYLGVFAIFILYLQNLIGRKTQTSLYYQIFEKEITSFIAGIGNRINKIKSNEEYHLILLDHQMEDASGVEVMIALKKLKEFFKVPPVIMVSANTGSNLREYYLSVGFNEYIAKPITVNEIQNALKKYVPGNVKKEPEIEEEKNEPMV